MRILIQRVTHAQVVVENEIVGKIGPGLLVLVGITHEDTQKDIEWLATKLMGLRIFNDEAGKMNLSVEDIGGDLLVVSQFTLFGNSRKGRRPSYSRSAPPDISKPLYEQFVAYLRQHFSGKVETGIYAAEMKVSLLNDGPVTLWLDSREMDY